MVDFASNLDIEEVKTEDKSLCSKLVVSEKHLNGHKTVHGGCYYAMSAESISIYVGRIGRDAVGLDGCIHHYRPAKPGDTLYCYVTERKIGKKVGNFLIEVKNQDGKTMTDAMIEVMFCDKIASE